MAGLLYVIIAMVVVMATYAAQSYLKNRKFWQMVGKIKGEKTLPLIGHAHLFSLDAEVMLNTVLEMFYKMGCGTFKVLIGNVPTIVLCEPETAEVLLGSNKEIQKLHEYNFLTDWLGEGLLTANGNKWKRQRKIITPTFHFKILEQFLDVFNEKGDILIQKFSLNKGKVFDINPYVTLYALDVICQTAMGVNINAQNDAKSDYVQAVYRLSNIFTLRAMSPFKRLDWMFALTQDARDQKRAIKIIHSMTKEIIRTRKITLRDEIEKVMSGENTTLEADACDNGKQKKVAFLDLLLLSKTPEGNPLSDESIREETDTFMFEGHDTTSAAISFAVYSLANNTEVQRKVAEEQRSILGDDLSKHPSFADLQDMKYLEMVIKETLRLYPSVSIFGRELSNDLSLPDGTVIPGGCQIAVFAFLMGRNPKCWTNPTNFDPDRFLPENARLRNPYAFSAFSAGPRNCIGQKFAMLEMKSILSKILRNFELSTAGPGTELRLAVELTLKSKNGHQIVINDRIYK